MFNGYRTIVTDPNELSSGSNVKSNFDIKNIAIVALVFAWALTIGIFGLFEISFQRDKSYLHDSIASASKALDIQKQLSDELQTQIGALEATLAASETKVVDLSRRLAEANEDKKKGMREIGSLTSRVQRLSNELSAQEELNKNLHHQLAIANEEIIRLKSAVQSLMIQLKEIREPAPISEQ